MEATAKTPNLLKGLLISLVATLLMTLVLELVVRAFIPVRHVGPAFSVHDMVQGKRLRERFTATRTTPEFEFELKTNSLGMRGPEPTTDTRGGVAFIGDSFTLGYGVENDETFPALVRARLAARGTAAAVLNLGIGNSGNGRWLKLLDTVVPRHEPKVIVLQLMGNDFSDNHRDGLYVLDDQGALQALPISPPGVGRKAQAVVDAIPGLAYSYLLGLAWTAAGGQGLSFSARPPPDPNLEQPGDRLTYALVGEAAKRARGSGAEVIVLVVGVVGPRLAKVRQVLDDAGVPMVVTPVKADAPELFYEIDGHWNARGHQMAAELLTPLVTERLSR